MKVSDTKEPQKTTGLVDVSTLIQEAFHPACRPSIRTVRRLVAARKIPFLKFGGRFFFCVDDVRAAMKG
jgi:hypothetical protein